VTGHDAGGKAVIMLDGDAPKQFQQPGSPLTSTLLWVTDETPTPLSDTDNADREIGINPPNPGTIFRILEFPPEQKRTTEELEELVAEINRRQAENPMPGVYRNPSVRATGMHRTESIDYALVLDGEIDLLLDEEETRLKAGDVVVMQGTYHSWHNRSDKTCMMAFILVGATVPWK
jgi:hypothetical protein